MVARHAAAPPADAPASNDLIDLVQAKHTSVLRSHDDDVVQLDNFIYGARSFLNKEDLYYVDQEIQFAKRGHLSALLWQSYSANLPLHPNTSSNVSLLRPSPETSWIWAVPLEAYASEQEPFVFDSLARMRAGAFYFGRIHIHADFTARVESLVDQPFPTKTILPPSIAKVQPKTVPVAGQATISGEGFYPGLFSNVLLGGNALPAANVTNSSDRQIIVTVPNDTSSFPPGKPLAVQVNTGAGASNNNQTLTILRNTADQAANVLQ